MYFFWIIIWWSITFTELNKVQRGNEWKKLYLKNSFGLIFYELSWEDQESERENLLQLVCCTFGYLIFCPPMKLLWRIEFSKWVIRELRARAKFKVLPQNDCCSRGLSFHALWANEHFCNLMSEHLNTKPHEPQKKTFFDITLEKKPHDIPYLLIIRYLSNTSH